MRLPEFSVRKAGLVVVGAGWVPVFALVLGDRAAALLGVGLGAAMLAYYGYRTRVEDPAEGRPDSMAAHPGLGGPFFFSQPLLYGGVGFLLGAAWVLV